MKIAIASDHAGFRLKEEAKQLLRELGHEVRDFGAHSEEPVDYPDFIVQAADAVRRGECERAIVLGGSGNGEAMVANKVPGIRCALCHDVTTARLARAHNDANVLALGQRITGSEVAKDVVQMWLDTPFEGGRHQRRLDKMAAVEAKLAGRAGPARSGAHKTRRGGKAI
jgi:ribose 5-phosphate isomerase B